MVNGVPMQSLRLALLNTLGDWPASEGLALAREILGKTSRMAEATIAISQMEKSAPGVYRAEAIQAIQAVQQRAANAGAKDPWESGGTGIFDVMRQMKSTELLPVAESAVGKNPWAAQQFIAALDALPAEVRAPALQRLFENEAVKKNMTGNAWMMQSLNYAEPVIAQNVAQIFATNTDKRFRENFLQGIAQPMSFTSDGTADRVAKLQARAAFVEAIAPQCNTPVLQERLQDAREALQKAIANPDDNGLTKRGSGTLILGSEANVYSGGTTIIGAGSIQIGTTTEKK
jgi:autotransporter-associated beta strand protein